MEGRVLGFGGERESVKGLGSGRKDFILGFSLLCKIKPFLGPLGLLVFTTKLALCAPSFAHRALKIKYPSWFGD